MSFHFFSYAWIQTMFLVVQQRSSCSYEIDYSKDFFLLMPGALLQLFRPPVFSCSIWKYAARISLISFLDIAGGRGGFMNALTRPPKLFCHHFICSRPDNTEIFILWKLSTKIVNERLCSVYEYDPIISSCLTGLKEE